MLSPLPVYLPELQDIDFGDSQKPAAAPTSPTKKITKDDLWDLWQSRGTGGGFVSHNTYMVYSEQQQDEEGEEGARSLSRTHNPLVAVSASPFHTLMLDGKGRVYACGWNRHCQLGVERADKQQCNYPSPVTFPTSSSNPAFTVKSVACGAYHSCCSTSSGRVYTWGDGSKGQLGYTEVDVAGDVIKNRRDEKRRSASSQFTVAGGGRSFRNAVPRMVEELEHVCQVRAGFYHTVVVTGAAKPRAYGFGDNSEGQIGLGSQCGMTTMPKRVNLGGCNVRDAQCGDNHTLFLTDEGAVWSTGMHTHGRLGRGEEEEGGEGGNNKEVRVRTKSRIHQRLGRGSLASPIASTHIAPQPKLVDRFDLLGVHVVKIEAGGASSAAISNSKDVFLWGYNEAGNLGLGHEKNVYFPERLKLLKGTDVALSEVSEKYSHKLNFLLQTWGDI